jgi:hypothetical protein
MNHSATVNPTFKPDPSTDLTVQLTQQSQVTATLPSGRVLTLRIATLPHGTRYLMEGSPTGSHDIAVEADVTSPARLLAHWSSYVTAAASFLQRRTPEDMTMTTNNTDLKSIIGTLTAALGELSTRLDGGGAQGEVLERLTKLEGAIKELEAGTIDHYTVASNIDLSDLASEISTSDLASEISLRELAAEIDFPSAIEDNLDVDSIVSQVKDSLDIEEKVKAVLTPLLSVLIRKLVREELAAALKSVRLTVEAA